MKNKIKTLLLATIILSSAQATETFNPLQLDNLDGASRSFVDWFKNAYKQDAGAQLNSSFAVEGIARDRFCFYERYEEFYEEARKGKILDFFGNERKVVTVFSLRANNGIHAQVTGNLFGGNKLELFKIDLWHNIVVGLGDSPVSTAESQLEEEKIPTTGVNIAERLFENAQCLYKATQNGNTLNCPLVVDKPGNVKSYGVKLYFRHPAQ